MAPPTLFQFRASHFTEKARWALDWKGIPHVRHMLLPGPHLPRMLWMTGQQQVPVLVIGCVQGRVVETPLLVMQASTYGSIAPAAWSFMLAARARGLGSAWTTLHLPNEKEVAELLGIPYDKWSQAGLFPIAYTVGTDFKPAKRLPTDQFIHWDTW